MRCFIRLRIAVICVMVAALFFNATWFSGKITSSALWMSFFLAILMLVFDKDNNAKIVSYKIFIQCAVLFLGSSFLSIMRSFILADNMGLLVDALKIWISYIVYLFFLTMTMTSLSEEDMKKELNAVASFCVLLSVIPIFTGAVQAFFPWIRIPYSLSPEGAIYWAGRYYTLFINPNGHSQIIFVLFLMAQYLKLNNIKKKRGFFIVYQVLCFINLCMCASRGTLVAIIAVGLLYDGMIYLLFRRKNYTQGINLFYMMKRGICLFVCAFILYYSCNYIPNIFPSFMETVEESTTDSVTYMTDLQSDTIENSVEEPIVVRDYYEHGDDISNGRLDFWKYALRTFLSHPLFGVGLYSELFISCHNGYITLLLAYGMIGLAFFCMMILIIFDSMRMRMERLHDLEEIKKEAVFVGCLIGIFVIALTNDALIFTFEFINIFAYYLMGYMMRPFGRRDVIDGNI